MGVTVTPLNIIYCPNADLMLGQRDRLWPPKIISIWYLVFDVSCLLRHCSHNPLALIHIHSISVGYEIAY